MAAMDHRPIRQTPVAARITSRHNNRYGAVISSLYAFWVARRATNRARRDLTSIILFDSQPKVRDLSFLMELWPELMSKAILRADNTKSAEELVDCLLGEHNGGGTNYDRAIEEVRVVMESQWSPDRYQIVPIKRFRFNANYYAIGCPSRYSCLTENVGSRKRT